VTEGFGFGALYGQPQRATLSVEETEAKAAFELLEWIAKHDGASHLDLGYRTDCEEADAFRDVVQRCRLFVAQLTKNRAATKSQGQH
jgi:hypothetical protein